MKQLIFLMALVVAGCDKPKLNSKTKQRITAAEFNKADSLYKSKADSAFYFFNQIVQKSQDSLQIAAAYNYMAHIQIAAGDYFGSQESALASIQRLDERDIKHYYYFFSDYTVLANNCLSLKNYDSVITYCDRAIKFASDESDKLYPLNSKALAYQKKKEYDKAIDIYQSIISKSVTSPEYPRILSNFARTKWLQNPQYNPLPEFRAALEIREQKKDSLGLNASYSHISDYYSSFLPDSGLFYAKKMYEIAKLNNLPDDQLEALDKLTNLTSFKQSRQYDHRFHQLLDSVQLVRDTAKNQFAIIRYSAAQSKADNLVLQKDISEKDTKIFMQQLLFGAVSLLVIFATIFSLIWYRKRKQRLQLEAQNAIREHQLKTSQKVHDVVANGLYHLMTEIEHQPTPEKETLLDKIEVLYEQSRDISYEQPEHITQGFEETIAQLMAPFANDITKIALVGNDNTTWNKIKPEIRKQLVPILQELMVNMKKHSQAQKVSVKFQAEENNCIILYQDDGVGLTPAFQQGNGLKNTENRIKALGGQISFDKAVPSGLRVKISFPIT